jgi:hypothetical protein
LIPQTPEVLFFSSEIVPRQYRRKWRPDAGGMLLLIFHDLKTKKRTRKPAARFPWLNAPLSAGRSFHLKKKRSSGAIGLNYCIRVPGKTGRSRFAIF